MYKASIETRDALIRAFRADPTVGWKTGSMWDECYSDEEIISEFEAFREGLEDEPQMIPKFIRWCHEVEMQQGEIDDWLNR